MDPITLIVFSVFCLMTFTFFVIIRYGKSNRFLYFIIPLILWISISIYPSIQKVVGYPIEATNIEDQLYVSHIIGIDQKWIYFWLIDIKESYIPRAYKVVYTKEREKQAAEAKEKSSKGTPQGLTLEDTGSQNDSERTMSLYDFDKMKGVTK